MKKIVNIIASLAVALTFTSCDLDQMPKDQLTFEDPSKIFFDLTEASYFSNGLAEKYRDVQQGLYWQQSEYQGDMFSNSTSSGNRGGSVHRMDDSFTSSDYDCADIWAGNYSLIMQVNYFLLNVPNIDHSQLQAAEVTELNGMIGQAYFYRAAAYHTLASQFALPYVGNEDELGVPVFTEPDVELKPARVSLQETYAQINSDLTAAKSSLDQAAGAIRADKPTIDAVNALDARVQLWMGNYSGAITAADKVINSSANYALASTVEGITKEFVTQDGTESILMLARTQAEGGPNNTAFLMSASKDADGGYSYEADFYPNQRLIDLYDLDNDIRVPVFLAETKCRYATSTFVIRAFTKYQGNPALTQNTYYSCVTAARVFALPEMYLTKAEAQSMSGDQEGAKATINTLQAARGAVISDGSMASIQDEWARETVGEGMRIVCLKRWGQGFTNRPQVSISGSVGVSYLSQGEGNAVIDAEPSSSIYFRFVWPVPQSDRAVNPNLVQNPGW